MKVGVMPDSRLAPPAHTARAFRGTREQRPHMRGPGLDPVEFVALKVVPEVENVPIGQRPRWQTRTRDRVLEDLRAELGVRG